MYLMEMWNRVSEVENLLSIVSDRDAPADEVGSAGLFCLPCGGTKTDTLTSLRYARDMTMMAKSNKVERLAHYHLGCVFTFKSSDGLFYNGMLQARELAYKMGNNSLCVAMTDHDAEPQKKVLQFIRCMCTSTETLSLLLLYYVMLTCILWCAIFMVNSK